MDEDWDDVELTVRSWDEPEAFGVVLERHAETLPGYFARRTLDPEATAELTAETFAQAFASRRRSEITGSERSGGCTGSPATSSAASSGTGRWTLAPDAASGWRSGRVSPENYERIEETTISSRWGEPSGRRSRSCPRSSARR
jgi:hypothetical protein